MSRLLFVSKFQIANVKMWNETCKKLRISKDSKKKAHKKKRGPSEKRKIFLCSFHRFIYDLQVCEKKVKSAKKRNLHHTAFPVRYVDIRRQRCLLLVLRITYVHSFTFQIQGGSKFAIRTKVVLQKRPCNAI